MTSTSGGLGNTPVVRVTGFDHLVLRCSDVETTLAFYAQTLGLPTERVDQWRGGQVPFPSVRIDATTLIDLVACQPGSAEARSRGSANLDHLCLVVSADTDLSALAASGQMNVVDGPATRWGAQGHATSLYVTDPDGTVVELRAYPS